MELKKGDAQQNYEIRREGGEDILYLDFSQLAYSPSISDHPEIMETSIDHLIENPNVSRIIFVQDKNYNYDFKETSYLLEIASLYVYFLKQEKILSFQKLVKANEGAFTQRYNALFSFLYLLKKDPFLAYFELKKILLESKIALERSSESFKMDLVNYTNLLEKIFSLVENTKLIQDLLIYAPSYRKGNREIYHHAFKPDIIPNFTFTRLVSDLPSDAEIVDQYDVSINEYDVSNVTILKVKDESKLFYYLNPPENSLKEEHNSLLNLARNVLIEHQPKAEEFTDTERTRQVFFNVSKDLIRDLGEAKNIKLSYEDLNRLATILVRHTIGFGLVEVLLQDKNIQDISLNAPISKVPIYVRHQDHDECSTNILPSFEDANSWAAKFRMISGRPLDESSPILDTQLEIGKIRARIAIIQNPLSPDGLAYSIRRHRESPWTLPLFIQNKMLNPLSAGLLSFLIDGARTLLVAGTRSSGKTSLLGSLMLEINPKARIITVEDSLELPVEHMRKLNYNILRMKVRSALLKTTSEVSAEDGIRTSLRLGDSALIVGEVRSSLRGSEEVVIVNEGLCKRVQIKDLEGKDFSKIFVPTLTKENKIELKKLTGFAKHPKRKKLVNIITKSGRSVTVTPDHSVFTNVNFKIATINSDKLKKGDSIIIPSRMPCGFKDVGFINLLEIFKDNYRLENAELYIRKAIKILGWKKASKICEVTDIYRYLLSTQKTRIPIKSFLKLMEKAKINYNVGELRVKKGNSKSLPVRFPINENVLRFIGYYLAEGNIDKNKIQITNSKSKIIEDVKFICKKEFGLDVTQRKTKGYGSSVQMSVMCKPLMDLLIYFGCGKTSFFKRIPEFVYGLNEKKISAMLRGMYSGDGSISLSKKAGNMIRYFSTSKKLVEDVSYALLCLGIVCRLHSRKSKIEGYKEIFIAEIKKRNYVEKFLGSVGFTHKDPEILIKSFSHSKNDCVNFDVFDLNKHVKLSRKYRYLRRTGSCSKDYLKKISEELKCSSEFYDFANGDFFVDRIKSIEEINLEEGEFVYDLNVASTERFIGGFGGILLHNTEAKALYEAMRVGALANVVAGTIHGASPYGVYDRVVNDLGVPVTSFKATDIIAVANPIKSADGLYSWRRLLEVAEIRKHWEKDPVLEQGFIDLMKYDVEKDELNPTSDLINGESEVIKDIASKVKGWAGNWDAVYDNILIRAKIKKEIVDVAEKTKKPELLEAEFNKLANHHFHKISDEVIREIGLPLGERVFPKWQQWLNERIKKMNF